VHAGVRRCWCAGWCCACRGDVVLVCWMGAIVHAGARWCWCAEWAMLVVPVAGNKRLRLLSHVGVPFWPCLPCCLHVPGPHLTWHRPTSLARLLALKGQHPDAKLVVGNSEVCASVCRCVPVCAGVCQCVPVCAKPGLGDHPRATRKV
jgi:hypothetical protein